MRKVLLIALVCVMGLAFSSAHAQQKEDARKQFLEQEPKANAGDPEAQFKLAFHYGQGRGVEKNIPEEVKFFRLAAEQNYAPAQVQLGRCYASAHGVALDRKAALDWFRKAAAQNSSAGQFELAVCYWRGLAVERDAAEAAKYFRKAAEQNHLTAQSNLAFCLKTGQGVKADSVEAYAWFELVVERDPLALKFRDELAQQMTPEKIASGTKRAEDLRAEIEARRNRGVK